MYYLVCNRKETKNKRNQDLSCLHLKYFFLNKKDMRTQKHFLVNFAEV